MAEAKALYNNQGNRGSAYILNNGWSTPLGMVQQQEEVQRQERAAQEAAKAQRQKEAGAAISKLMEKNYGDAYEGDLPYLNQEYNSILDKATQYQMEGRNWWNPMADPEAYRDMMQSTNALGSNFQASKQYLDTRKQATDILNNPASTTIDKETALADLQALDAMPIAERSKSGPFTIDAYQDYNKLLDESFKGIDLTEETVERKGNDGYIYNDKVKTYTGVQLDAAAKNLMDSYGFKASAKREYNKLSEDEKQKYGSLEAFQEWKSKDLALRRQKKDVIGSIKTDGTWNANQSRAERAKKEGQGNEKYRNSVTNRFNLIHGMLTNKNTAGYQPLVGGKHGNYPIMAATRKVKNGKAVLELTVGLGSTTGEFKEDPQGNMVWVPSKTKETKTDIVEIDLSTKGIHTVLNGIINSKAKEKVDDEDLLADAANNGRWGLGNSGNKKPITAPSQSSSTTDDDEYWNSDDSSANEGDYWNE